MQAQQASYLPPGKTQLEPSVVFIDETFTYSYHSQSGEGPHGTSPPMTPNGWFLLDNQSGQFDLYDDGTHGDAVSGDDVWTRACLHWPLDSIAEGEMVGDHDWYVVLDPSMRGMAPFEEQSDVVRTTDGGYFVNIGESYGERWTNGWQLVNPSSCTACYDAWNVSGHAFDFIAMQTRDAVGGWGYVRSHDPVGNIGQHPPCLYNSFCYSPLDGKEHPELRGILDMRYTHNLGLTHEIGHGFLGLDSGEFPEQGEGSWNGGDGMHLDSDTTVRGDLSGPFWDPNRGWPHAVQIEDENGERTEVRLIHDNGSFRIIPDGPERMVWSDIFLYMAGFLSAEDATEVNYKLVNESIEGCVEESGPLFCTETNVTAERVIEFDTQDFIEMYGERIPAHDGDESQFNLGILYISDRNHTEAEMIWFSEMYKEWAHSNESESSNWEYTHSDPWPVVTRGLSTVNIDPTQMTQRPLANTSLLISGEPNPWPEPENCKQEFDVQSEDGLSVGGNPDANEAGMAHFTKYSEVFGLGVYAESGISDEQVIHAATIMAELLDNDEDGVVDDEGLLSRLHDMGAIMPMFDYEGSQAYDDFFSNYEGDGVGAVLFADEVDPLRPGQWGYDASIEEIMHTINHVGHTDIYPEAFGLEPDSSLLSDAMDVARGGQFISHPSSYPEEAWYHYDDSTCDYECMAIEYLYWAQVSNMGVLDDSQTCYWISDEWEPCSKELLESMDVLVYDLITDPQYLLPQVAPDGFYAPFVGNWTSSELCAIYAHTASAIDSLRFVYADGSYIDTGGSQPDFPDHQWIIPAGHTISQVDFSIHDRISGSNSEIDGMITSITFRTQGDDGSSSYRTFQSWEFANWEGSSPSHTYNGERVIEWGSFSTPGPYHQIYYVHLTEDCWHCKDVEGVLTDMPPDADGDGVPDEFEVLGCTDAVANNHDPSATEEDGTCDYDLDDDGFNDELEDHCLSDPLDPSSTPEDNDSDGVCDELDDDDDGDGVNDIDEVLGCTDAVANNHNHLATEEDGTCDYDLDNDGVNDIDEVLGCTNPVANNYDPMATDHEKTCDYDLDDDGVNDIDEVTGCTDSSADNFNPSATDEDGSCYYLTPLPPLSVGDEVEVDGVWACISEVNTNYILLDYLNGSDAEPVFYEMPKFDLVKKSNGGVLDCSGEGEEDPDCCEPPEPSEPVPGWGALLAASVLLLASMVRSRRSESVD
jgi:hypothetical protein